MSNSVRPHRQQPTRLRRPCDSLGKNTGVGCHFLLHCMEVKSESEVTQSCPTLGDPMDCSLPGSSIHGIFQARVGCHCLLQGRILEWKDLPPPRDPTGGSLALQADSLPLAPPSNPVVVLFSFVLLILAKIFISAVEFHFSFDL